MGTYYPQNILQHDDKYVVNFWRETKNSANWCAQQSWGIPRKMANLILITLYFSLGTYLFPRIKCFRQFRKQISKIMIHSKLQEPTFKNKNTVIVQSWVCILYSEFSHSEVPKAIPMNMVHLKTANL